ncbi:S41 family peptidase [Sphingomonas sp.]|uniref:S41 family peptidase n=1 Tax=Sphingomonas sp. TaxID=28214 RepID=UPI003D6D6A70
MRPMTAAAILTGLCLATAGPAAPAQVPAATTPVPETAPVSPVDIRADFASLYATLQEAHYDLFAHRPKRDYDAYFHTLDATIRAPMDKAQAARLFQRFMAYGRIGHARIDAPTVDFVTALRGGGKFLPLFIRVDGDRTFLTAPAEESGTIGAGAELVAISGQPIGTWLTRLGGYVSAERSYMAHAQMEESFPALLWMDLGPVESVPVTVRINGRRVTMPIKAVTFEGRRALARRFPAASLKTDFETRDYKVLADGIGYLRPGPFFNTDGKADGPAPSYDASSFRRFIDDSFARIVASGATDLIIDVRNNPGGDNSFSDPMVAWFADRPFRFASSFMLKASAATKAYYLRQKARAEPVDADLARMMETEARQPNGTRYAYDLPLVAPRAEPRFHGRIWVLANRHSYSNAASVAALVQDYKFGKVMGEETADVASNYASVLYFDLPRTGITVTYPKSHFIRPNGADEVTGVVPDVMLPRQPITGDRDVMLDAALRHVQHEASRTP